MADTDHSAPLPRRRLGGTGEQVPILGLGTAPGGMGLPDTAAAALYETAIDLGVTYLDTAPGYERAQKQLGQILPRRRDEVFLVTKTFTADSLTYGFEHHVLPAAMARHVGVAAMKVYGGAQEMKYETAAGEDRRPSAIHAVEADFDYERALRWALSLPGVATAVVGVYSEEELRQDIAWARRLRPLNEAEQRDLRDLAPRLATHWGEHFGARHEPAPQP